MITRLQSRLLVVIVGLAVSATVLIFFPAAMKSMFSVPFMVTLPAQSVCPVIAEATIRSLEPFVGQVPTNVSEPDEMPL